MLGAIYARYSEGPQQSDQSIEGQVSDCRAFAERNGIQIIEVYADRHISGKSVVGRHEFQRMLRDAQDHRFDCVIVWKIDRFGRDRQDIAVSKMKLKKAGVKLMYAEESVPEGPEGIILESVLEGLAEYYSADLRQKVIRGRRETLKKGMYCGGSLPVGYRLDENRHAVPDENAKHVREVFRMYAAGAKIVDCMEYLNAHGVKPTRKASDRMTKSSLGRMLRNERYLGIFDVSGVELRFEPIVDEATFLLCQDRHPGDQRLNASGRATTDLLLSCRCFCGLCGTMLNGDSGRGKAGRVYYYYKCAKRKRGRGCTLGAVPKEELESLVVNATTKDMLTDEVIRMLADEVMRIQDEDREHDPARVIETALDSCRKRQRNLIRAIEETGTPGLAARLAQLEQEEQDLLLELKRAEVRSPRLSREDVILWLKSFQDGNKDDPTFRKKLLETFVARVDVFDEKLVVFYNVSEKSKQKRIVPRCSSTTRLLDNSDLYPNTPTMLGGYFVLLVSRIA